MPGEVYFEFTRIGGTVKVTAVDADTGVEAVVIGAASASEAVMRQLALRKLDYVLRRREAGLLGKD